MRVLLSGGGMDSIICLGLAKEGYIDPFDRVFTANYGQVAFKAEALATLTAMHILQNEAEINPGHLFLRHLYGRHLKEWFTTDFMGMKDFPFPNFPVNDGLSVPFGVYDCSERMQLNNPRFKTDGHFLVSEGADVNTPNSDGSDLYYVQTRNLTLVLTLIEHLYANYSNEVRH